MCAPARLPASLPGCPHTFLSRGRARSLARCFSDNELSLAMQTVETRDSEYPWPPACLPACLRNRSADYDEVRTDADADEAVQMTGEGRGYQLPIRALTGTTDAVRE